jgi:putative membrane protein
MLGTRRSAFLDAALGAGAGLIASWVMSLAYKPIMGAGDDETLRREKEAAEGLPPATIRAAQVAAEKVGRPLPDDRGAQALGGKIIHYVYGTLWGAAFALAARTFAPRAPLAAGLGFGVVLWVLSDEMLVPLFKLSHPPTRYPATSHAKGLASHLVYGVATDAAWRLARAPLR